MSAAQKGRQPIHEHMHTSNIILKQQKKKCFVGTFTTPRVIFLASGVLYGRRKILINRCQHLATFVAASLINLCFLHLCVWSAFFFPAPLPLSVLTRFDYTSKSIQVLMGVR